MITCPQARNRASAFTLLELVIVLVITTTIVALAAEGYAGMMQSAAVTTGADMISDAFADARTDAVAQNMPVEVRIYCVAPSSGGAPAYQALQLHWVKPDGTTPQVSQVKFLSSFAAIDATVEHSTLIASNSQPVPVDANDTRMNSQTRVFHFLADGTTDLAAGTNWFLTVRPASQSDPAHFPSNWACVKVDPVSGRPQIYRP